jgi:hypothetical protein
MTSTIQLKLAHAVSRDDIRARLAALLQSPPPSHGLRDLLLGAGAGGALGTAGGGVVGLGLGYGRGALDATRLARDLFDPEAAAFARLKNVTPRA